MTDSMVGSVGGRVKAFSHFREGLISFLRTLSVPGTCMGSCLVQALISHRCGMHM